MSQKFASIAIVLIVMFALAGPNQRMVEVVLLILIASCMSALFYDLVRLRVLGIIGLLIGALISYIIYENPVYYVFITWISAILGSIANFLGGAYLGVGRKPFVKLVYHLYFFVSITLSLFFWSKILTLQIFKGYINVIFPQMGPGNSATFEGPLKYVQTCGLLFTAIVCFSFAKSVYRFRWFAPRSYLSLSISVLFSYFIGIYLPVAMPTYIILGILASLAGWIAGQIKGLFW